MPTHTTTQPKNNSMHPSMPSYSSTWVSKPSYGAFSSPSAWSSVSLAVDGTSLSKFRRLSASLRVNLPLTHPPQSLAFALTFAGIVLGHAHGGRQFPHSFHGSLGSWLLVPILAQLVLGIYLKLHIHERTLRPYAVRAHGILGRVWPILGWVQGLFGVIVLRGFCGEVGAGQCAAHYIMVKKTWKVAVPRTRSSFFREARSLDMGSSWPSC